MLTSVSLKRFMAFLVTVLSLSSFAKVSAEPLKIGYSDWPGWVAWEVAIEKEWFKKAGVDLLEYIKKYPGLFCSYHIKDANKDLEQTAIGTGIIDFGSILAENKKAGIQYVFGEDGRLNTPLENAKNGYNFLKGIEYNYF